jgi:hypothetical protein
MFTLSIDKANDGSILMINITFSTRSLLKIRTVTLAGLMSTSTYKSLT